MRLPYAAPNHVRVSSAYGHRVDPITGAVNTWHSGIDLVGMDNKVLVAPVGGVVLVSQIVTDPSNRTSEWGNYVCIRGDDGYLYYLCHMESRAVFANHRVEEGDFIGFEGSTGYSTGSHCHFEVRDASGKAIDPTKLLGIENKAGNLYVVPEEKESEEDIMAKLDNKPNAWSEEAVTWAVENGIMQGDEKGDLMLRKTATREQIVVMLHRLYKLLKGE